MKITKKLRKQFIHRLLSENRVWAQHALLLVYNYQTREEKVAERTAVENGVGFTAFDGEILASFSKQILKGYTLTEKQWKVLMKKMPKYWGQIYEVCDLHKLDSLITSYLKDQEPIQLEMTLETTC